MPDEIRKDLLQSSQIGKDKYQDFHSGRFITKSTPLRDTIHRSNLKTMAKIKEKPKMSASTMKRTMNLTEKAIEVARDRGLTSDDLLAYDINPSPVLFDDDGLMTKPDKNSLIRELEASLRKEDYSYHHEPN